MKRKVLSILPVLLSASILITACAAKNNEQAQGSVPDQQANTSVSEKPAQPATLKWWTTWQPTPNTPDFVEPFAEEFTKENPNIKIDRTTIAWSDFRNTLVPALNSGEGPDVFNYTPGPGNIGVLAKAGLLMDIGDCVQQFEWNKIFEDWYLESNYIEGKLYGLSNAQTLLGVFYNKKVFNDNGLSVPRTYEELLDVCKKLKDAGITPISISTKDAGPTYHYGTMFYTAFAGANKLSEAEQTRRGFDSPEFVEALDAFVGLVENGYTFKDPNGVGAQDGNSEFLTGKTAMRFMGSWVGASYYDQMGDNVGFFPMPAKSGTPGGYCGGLGDQVVIYSKTKSPEAAKNLLNAVIKDANLWTNIYIPVSKVSSADSLKLNPLQKQIYAEIQNTKTIAPILDIYLPQEFNEGYKNEFQKLAAGKVTPEEMSGNLQKLLEELQ